MNLSHPSAVIYLTVKQVAARLVKSEWWVYMALEKEAMPGRKIGGSWRIPYDELLLWEQGNWIKR